MYQSIDFQIQGPVARLALDRPPLNIINIPMMAEMVEALTSLKEQPSVRALVIAAAEGSKAFSAGVDVADHTADKVHDMILGFHRVFRLLNELNIPTLAVVDGAALGGGCELAIFCDMIVASERAKFGQPEIKVGVFPPIAVILLPRLIPRAPALELLLTGETISAVEAYRLGLVNRVVSPEAVTTTVDELIGKVTSLSGRVLRYTRQAALLGATGSFEQTLEHIEKLYLDDLMQALDAHEGLAAFMERREPVWQDK
jgi:cyclohexa-1,5-dienecarbonyl-CoA hydratase